MGTIKRLRKKYQTPSHLWQKERILEEQEYKKEYGLKNKREIWKMNSLMKKFKNLSKDAISSDTKQGEAQSVQLLTRLRSLGLLNETSMLSDVLTLTDKDIMERRLQTVVFRNGLARSPKQSRQFIVHGHIKINGVKISSPSYLVKKAEEASIEFVPTSTLSKEDHPERNIQVQKAPVKKAEEKPEAKSEKKAEGKTEKPKKKPEVDKKEEKKEEPKEKATK